MEGEVREDIGLLVELVAYACLGFAGVIGICMTGLIFLKILFRFFEVGISVKVFLFSLEILESFMELLFRMASDRGGDIGVLGPKSHNIRT